MAARLRSRFIPFFAFPPAVRRVIYTTNAIGNVNSRLRKIIKTRGHFPRDDAATKLLWLALRNITANWTRVAKEWCEAMKQFAILYEEPAPDGDGERFPGALPTPTDQSANSPHTEFRISRVRRAAL